MLKRLFGWSSAKEICLSISKILAISCIMITIDFRKQKHYSGGGILEGWVEGRGYYLLYYCS